MNDEKISLTAVSSGLKARIENIEQTNNLDKKLSRLGLLANQYVHVLKNDLKDPLIIKCRGSTYIMSRSDAAKIYVYEDSIEQSKMSGQSKSINSPSFFSKLKKYFT